MDARGVAGSFWPSGDDSAALWRLAQHAAGQKEGELAAGLMMEAVKSSPSDPNLHFEFGGLLATLGWREEAVREFREAARLSPADGTLWGRLGDALAGAADHQGALEAFASALSIDPNQPEIQTNMGIIYARLGRAAEAEAAYQAAIRLDPGFTPAQYNLGCLYQNQGQTDRAAVCYQAVLAVHPDHAESHNNLGTIFYAQGEPDRAAAHYRQVQALAPDWPVGFHNMANLLIKRSDNPGAAIPFARLALALKPDYTEAAVILLDACQRVCAWDDPDLEPLVKQLSSQALEAEGWTPENPLCAIRSSFDQAHHLAVAKGWAHKMADAAARESIRFSFKGHGRLDGPIRLGYLSRDFREHPVGHQIAGMFEHHDRRQFDITLYSGGVDDGSAARQRARQGADHFVDVAQWPPRRIAEAIHDDSIQILIDLTGHSGGSMLPVCALRPAPIQVSYLGFLGPSGADFMDYIITDRVVTPPEAAPYYTEKFVYLPHCYQVNDHRQSVAPLNAQRSDFGLPETGVVFACFNSPGKMDPLLFDTWMDILAGVPGSILWLAPCHGMAMDNLRRRSERRGIDPIRLIFAQRMSLPDHLARLKLADLALDTRMYNGGATTSNALWAGVPVITIQGGHFVSRMAASALTAVGLPDLVTENPDQYRDLALRLALDPEALQDVKQRLCRNRKTRPLFDTPRFVRHLETAFTVMWQRFQKDLPPAVMDIVP